MKTCEANQDEWILEKFKDPGFAVDVGANDGVLLSNTLAAETRGWRVLCIEANPDYEKALRASRKHVEICACGSKPQQSAEFFVNDVFPPAGSALIKNGPEYRTIRVPVRRLDDLIEKHQFPRVDLLSVDVEHTELDVLKSIDLVYWSVKAIIVESLTAGYVGADEAKKFESSLRDFLEPKGYICEGRTAEDLLFWRQP